ncbi:Hypothetical protein azo1651 [Azoarcus olearius]|uniref:Uncharacterized protein n=2 Tax=Azoarcus sp. (strain BH72) TaxID=418699 RepID=A1K613_AZOSB|nr:hypothetical protein dqs_1779 [Azoarcus olearius]CAL94268.1 Hypothetical protein azo1651 [Azoarcus olearius]
MGFMKLVGGAVAWLRQPWRAGDDGSALSVDARQVSNWPLSLPEPLCFVVDACPDALASETAP